MSHLKILVATGSSGGHIFPALAFLDSLSKNYPKAQTILVLPRKNKDKIKFICPGSCKVVYTSLSSVKIGFKREDIKDLLELFKCIFQTLKVLLKFQPDVVVGFGSIASVPAVMLGWLLRAKTIIHEQNVIPGKATKILAYIADKIAISFEESRVYFKGQADKIVVTGNPVRKQLIPLKKEQALDYFGLSRNKITVLVMGGSQSSHRINETFLGAVSLIKDKDKIQAIHLAGKADYESLKRWYDNSGISFALFDFLEPIHYAYSASDLALSRAGATTIAELSFFQVPAILVPYPYAQEHQFKNAKSLEEKGCAVIIKDRDLNVQVLKESLEAVISGQPGLKRMREKYTCFELKDAGGLLVKEAMSL